MPSPGKLRLSAKFPESAPAARQVLTGTVEVTAESPVSGVAAQNASAFLVRHGRVVTAPLPQDAVDVRLELAAREKKSVQATASLMSCEHGGGALQAGDYEIYAEFVLIADDGRPTPAYGGP